MRLFIGIPLPDNIKAALNQLAVGIPRARWTPQQNYHITLFFIGDTKQKTLAKVEAALAGISAPAFDFSLEKVGHFSRDDSHIVWVGVNVPPEMLSLHEKIEAAISGLGFKKEAREFSPHITIARLRDAPLSSIQDYLQDNRDFKTAAIKCNRFVLFSSEHPDGGHSVYTSLAEYKLKD